MRFERSLELRPFANALHQLRHMRELLQHRGLIGLAPEREHEGIDVERRIGLAHQPWAFLSQALLDHRPFEGLIGNVDSHAKNYSVLLQPRRSVLAPLYDLMTGLTWPNIVFHQKMTLWLGKLEVKLMQVGRGHTKGDTIAWIPSQKVLFSGDLVEFDATPYAGDAYYEDWPATLDAIAALKPEKLVPGRGAALQTAEQVAAGLKGTREFVSELYASVKAGAQAGKDLKAVYRETFDRLKPKYGHWVIFDHCMPFDVTRAYDLATGHTDPRIWTAERDIEMWKALEG